MSETIGDLGVIDAYVSRAMHGAFFGGVTPKLIFQSPDAFRRITEPATHYRNESSYRGAPVAFNPLLDSDTFEIQSLNRDGEVIDSKRYLLKIE